MAVLSEGLNANNDSLVKLYIEQVDLSISGNANGACEWSIELPLKKEKNRPLRGAC